jgi:hypothetical protein
MVFFRKQHGVDRALNRQGLPDTEGRKTDRNSPVYVGSVTQQILPRWVCYADALVP